MLRIKSLLFILSALCFIPAHTAMAQTQAPNAPRQKLALEPCRLPGWNEDVRCGQYEVYENREAKTGRKISLRVTAADAERELAGTFYGDYRLKAYRRACDIWPRSDTPASFATPVKSEAPVLMISGEADPVTPPWLAEAAARHLPNSRQIVIPHTGHFFIFPCVDKLIATFVAKGTAKELDASCLAQIRRPAFVTEEMLKALANAQMNAQNRTEQAAANEQVWQGVIDTGSAKLRVALRLTQSADGKLTGKFDCPDQQVMGLQIDAISRQEQTLRFEINVAAASYEGKLNAAGTEITGEWRQQGRSFPLNFSRAGGVAK
jgi:hypothetical protein